MGSRYVRVSVILELPVHWQWLPITWHAVRTNDLKNGKLLIRQPMIAVKDRHWMKIYSLFPTWYTAFLFTYNDCYLLSSTCFRPHRPIIRRSKLYMQHMVLSPSADVFVVRPLRKNFLNGRTTKTSAEGENTICCMYNLDLLMMGLWGLKHVEERR